MLADSTGETSPPELGKAENFGPKRTRLGSSAAVDADARQLVETLNSTHSQADAKIIRANIAIDSIGNCMSHPLGGGK